MRQCTGRIHAARASHVIFPLCAIMRAFVYGSLMSDAVLGVLLKRPIAKTNAVVHVRAVVHVLSLKLTLESGLAGLRAARSGWRSLPRRDPQAR